MPKTRAVVDNEEARLNALRDLNLLDTPPSESFDRLTRLASRLLQAPVSTVSLTDADRQWFKARVGVELTQIPRDQAPCHYAIQADELFVVPDMLQDDRFAASPLAQAGIRFYAGAPLITQSGFGLGTLCVVDDKPRQLDEDQGRVLRDLAAVVMTQVEVQNMIGRVDATSGLANQHRLFEDLHDLGHADAGRRLTGLMIEIVSGPQLAHGTRVLGAAYGEQVILTALALVQQAVGPDVRVYHVAPACCVVLLDGPAAGLMDRARAIRAMLQQPIRCNDVPVMPDTAIGIHEFAVADATARDVLRRLFNATDDARATDRAVATYDPHHDLRQARSFALVHDFADALEMPGQLDLAYQPRIDLATGACIGAEALLRWTHPTLGPVSPGEFVPIVEQTALARPMTAWVLDAGLRQAGLWRAGGHDLRLSINASALNLDEGDFAARIAAALDRHGVPPGAIELEFTESALARDSGRMTRQLHELRRLGVGLAIDDFGIGYSSLSYLQRLPATVLKIDRSFMQAMPASDRDRTLVRTMITMAHDLGYRVVGEGIESRAVLDLLAEWGCDEGQGYFISHPLPAAGLAAWLRARKPA